MRVAPDALAHGVPPQCCSECGHHHCLHGPNGCDAGRWSGGWGGRRRTPCGCMTPRAEIEAAFRATLPAERVAEMDRAALAVLARKVGR